MEINDTENHPPQNQDEHYDLAYDLSKLLLSGNFEYIKSVGQTLQALTSLFLTAYIALIVKAIPTLKELDLLLFSPILLWSLSLIIAFLISFVQIYRGDDFVVGDLQSVVSVYEKITSRRKKMLIIPALLSLFGMIAFFVSFNIILQSLTK